MVDVPGGITLNAAPIWGGSRPNVIAPEAGCEIDLRVPTAAEGERMEKALLGARRPIDARCTVRVEGGMNRPSFAENPGILALYDKARAHGGGDRHAAAQAASRRRVGREFHRGARRADARRARLPRRRRACEPRAYPVEAPGPARGADGRPARGAGRMMDVDPRAAKAAELMLQGWRDPARLLPGLPEELRPRDLAEAYSIQQAVMAELGPIGGWKVGAAGPGSAAQLRAHAARRHPCRHRRAARRPLADARRGGRDLLPHGQGPRHP